MTHRILFVCLGNICRSPTAEAVMRAKAASLGIPVQLDSAGTASWHTGKPPYGPMQVAAQARGYDMSALRARQVQPSDAKGFDLIVAMDEENRRDLAHLSRPVTLFTDYAPHLAATEVPDPYYTRDFDGALALIEACADGLLASLKPG
ncbi:low molecular weight protein-tyrosine-phosphatase [Marivita hallyeonensis]|uniref:protein-tyrosine-phosphatase n=1 Tax=Marivita hallyeonensis TaxID=996342 RepID=A0A1M5NNQ8_9RHOB|nr:low molecular weight protein-tyrosine-phosphatase [Marivita hallyeonensis]SHG90563.1 protein-tyrosine phosphatase [Marivita hallyeonensis]